MVIVRSLSLSLFPDYLIKNHPYEKVFIIIVCNRNIVHVMW